MPHHPLHGLHGTQHSVTRLVRGRKTLWLLLDLVANTRHRTRSICDCGLWRQARITPKRIAGIGAWLDIFEFVAYLAIAVNLLIWSITLGYGRRLVLELDIPYIDKEEQNTNASYLLRYAVLLISNIVLAYVISGAGKLIQLYWPDHPLWLLDERKEQRENVHREHELLLLHRRTQGHFGVLTVRVKECRHLHKMTRKEEEREYQTGTQRDPSVILRFQDSQQDLAIDRIVARGDEANRSRLRAHTLEEVGIAAASAAASAATGLGHNTILSKAATVLARDVPNPFITLRLHNSTSSKQITTGTRWQTRNPKWTGENDVARFVVNDANDTLCLAVFDNLQPWLARKLAGAAGRLPGTSQYADPEDAAFIGVATVALPEHDIDEAETTLWLPLFGHRNCLRACAAAPLNRCLDAAPSFVHRTELRPADQAQRQLWGALCTLSIARPGRRSR